MSLFKNQTGQTDGRTLPHIEMRTVEPRYSAPAFNEFRDKAHDLKSPIFFLLYFFVKLFHF